MSDPFRKLAERQILKAKVEGKLEKLVGEGKPLPNRPEEAFLDAGEAAAHRMMAEAGALPEEILLKRALAEAKDAWAKVKGTDAEKPAMARIAELEMKLSIAQDARRKFMKD